MASTFMPPPNTLNLTDGVALQRVAPLHGQFDNDGSFFSLKRLPPLRTVARFDCESALSSIPIKAEAIEAEATESKPNAAASRRERCRINQARYRKRQRQHADELDESIQQLQKEIEDLQAERQIIEQATSSTQSVWVVATDYFRHFRHGFTAAPPSVANSPFASQPYEPHRQLEFLRTAMAEDVTDGCLCGAEALLENWRLFTLLHGDLQVQLTSLEQLSGGSLLAATSVTLTIIQNTVLHLYPHLIRVGANGQEWSPLASRMLNQCLVVPGSVRFDWDSASGRVSRLESKLDMLTPMLKQLGSLEAVACVFGQASISLECRIVQ